MRERLPDRRLAPAGLAAVAAGAGLAFTVCVAVLPSLQFAYRGADLHLVLETIDAFIALLFCLLVYGRFRDRRRSQDGLLVGAALALATGTICFSLAPHIWGAPPSGPLTTWVPFAVRLLGSALLVAAAVVDGETVSRRPVWAWIAGPVGAALTVGFAATLLSDASVVVGDPDSSAAPALLESSTILVTHGIACVLAATAAVLFARSAARRDDELLRWVAAACALSAAARVAYALWPSVYVGYVYAGDVLRTGFYVLLLVGATQEIRSYWAARERAATLEERRRLARDLHDGITQELAYLRSQLRLARTDPASLERATSAADRALDESRSALAALTRHEDEPLSVTLRRAGEEVAARYGAELTSELDSAVTVTPQTREHLVRIVREAVGNAVRHGGARTVHVQLMGGTGGPALSVHDDGCGFDQTVARTGFGLVSMQERAARIGGALDLDSTPGRGTTIEVTVPRHLDRGP